MAYNIKLATFGTVGPVELSTSVESTDGMITSNTHSTTALWDNGTVGTDFTLTLPATGFDGQILNFKNLLTEYTNGFTLNGPVNQSIFPLTVEHRLDSSINEPVNFNMNNPRTYTLTGVYPEGIVIMDAMNMPVTNFTPSKTTREVTIDRNGRMIDGRTDDIVTSTRLQEFQLVYINDAFGWLAL